MGRFELELRHRASTRQGAGEKHLQFLRRISVAMDPWKAIDTHQSTVPDHGDELIRSVNLSKNFAPGIKARANYQLRSANYLRDNAQYDDVFLAEFDPRKFSFETLTREVIPLFIDAFEAYRASVRSIESSIDDWDRIVEICRSTGRDVNGRDGVFRIQPVNYWDRELCERAFQSTPAEIIRRLRGVVPKAELINGGVYVVCCTRFSDDSELDALDASVRKALQASWSCRVLDGNAIGTALSLWHRDPLP